MARIHSGVRITVLLSFLSLISEAPLFAADWNPLPDTGQTTCYDAEGNVLDPCPAPGEAFYGQDAQYFGPPPSYTDNGNGTVIDNNTKLIWQQNTADTNDDGSITTADELSWQEAVNYCDGLDFAGHTDWRLPGKIELQSIVDYGRTEPAINSVFSAVWYGNYWSSSTFADDPDEAWRVLFENGGDSWPAKTEQNFVRCVRTGSSALGPYTDNGNGTVTDAATGLTWQQQTGDTNDDGFITSSDALTWQDALAWCESSPLGGHDDWRLPNIRELLSLVDYSHYYPAINPAFHAQSSTYWSATTHTPGPHVAWVVGFSYGYSSYGYKPASHLVRCVRGGVLEPPTLSVRFAGNGAGTVHLDPPGTDCTKDCNRRYSPDATVTLTATADQGFTFDGWSGEGCSGTGTCALTMNSDKTITVVFTGPAKPLSPIYMLLDNKGE